MSTIKKWIALLGSITIDLVADILEMSKPTAQVLMRTACERGEIARKSESVRGTYYRYRYSLPKEPSKESCPTK